MTVSGNSMIRFPDHFFWGTATSAYQVEGGNDEWSDWGDWPAHAGKGCNFWNKYEYYLDLAAQLGTNAFRFSIEWARVEPERDRWNREALERYRLIIRACHARGIEPVVTLSHFTLPKWVAKTGGWSNPETVSRFIIYVAKIQKTLGAEIRYWITLNEPSVLISHGYLTGVWPPGKKLAVLEAIAARSNLVEAHRRAYRLIKLNQKAKVGAALNIAYHEPHRKDHLGDRLVTWVFQSAGDYGFLGAIRNSLDFIGLNYYFHNRLKFIWNPLHRFFQDTNENKLISDLGWEIHPEGIKPLVLELARRFKKPIFVTENGVADTRDSMRPKEIHDTLTSLGETIIEGASVIGYLHWSLMDNFEWACGFDAHFGLYAMDYTQMVAIPRQSTELYRAIIKNNSPSASILQSALSASSH
ncbi:MAG: glycoside hydrolase family 1 protein [Parcubacteria group bacterium]|nr:glycoside hydrolase family 1 protein [Parcubacteria group bacterium]